MTLPTRDRVVGQARSAWHKLKWGVRVAGPLETGRGLLRLARLKVTRPERSRIQLASGGCLEFDYPSQFPPLLVLFGDVIDPEYAFLRRVMPPDATVIDVGAAIGQFSVLAALNACRVVHAFEPSDANLATLERNLRLNGIEDTVVVHRMALAADEGQVAFPTAARTYMSRLDRNPNGAGGNNVVPVRRLDDQLDLLGVDHVDVLKVNVAGYEPAVLDGASAALDAGRIDVLVLLIGTTSMDWYRRLHISGYALGFYHPEHHTFHRIEVVDERLLHDRPWPARHLLAIREPLLKADVGDLRIEPFLTARSP